MNRINNILGPIIILLIGIPIILIFSPVILIVLLISYFHRINFEKKYSDFLNNNHGKNFFCYNNRKNSTNYIEKDIIPNLSDKIEIIYLNGKQVESKYDSEIISEALYSLKTYQRFPHLMKIRNGKLVDKSINNPLYNVLNMKKPKNELLKQINKFFELVDTKNGS